MWLLCATFMLIAAITAPTTAVMNKFTTNDTWVSVDVVAAAFVAPAAIDRRVHRWATGWSSPSRSQLGQSQQSCSRSSRYGERVGSWSAHMRIWSSVYTPELLAGHPIRHHRGQCSSCGCISDWFCPDSHRVHARGTPAHLLCILVRGTPEALLAKQTPWLRGWTSSCSMRTMKACAASRRANILGKASEHATFCQLLARADQ